MSDKTGQSPLQSKVRPHDTGEWRDALRRRWPFYALAALLALVILAYVDGGEEPIRPIVQEVSPSLISGTGR